ncbi:GIY-YIG catalytic domain-containing endonuclease [Acanthocystis turfacea Chlorella virus Br0604L]|nr:GIY-YIG catalytic domain-containing endonuclease [Acanthocystis turfacea Chlorella virus Br0604L]
MGFIYMLTSPSGKSYIGQTIKPIETRFKEHQTPSSQCVAISRAIRKYGWENFEKHWYEVPDEELDNHEELMIDVLGTLSPNGYNLKGGGGNGKPSEETKKKISAAKIGEKNHNYGKTLTDETKQKISIAISGEKNHMFGRTGEDHPMFGRTHTGVTKEKMSVTASGEKNPFYGQKHTEETKKKMSEARKGEKNPNSKKVYQYSTGGICMNSFASTGEAARSLGKSDGSIIRMCASGTRKTAYGFCWSYTKL